MQEHDRTSSEHTSAHSPLLDAIRSDDEGRKREALQKVYDILSAHAAAKLGQKHQHAEMQAMSVVQSVLVHEVAAGDLEKFNDDQHLEARLKRAIINKILDRKKRRRPGGLVVGEDGAQIDPAAEEPGLGTQVMNAEEMAVAAEKLARFRKTCLAAPISDTQRAILDLVIFKEAMWQQVADECGTTIAAAKARLSEARPKVVAHLLEPLREKCDGETWQIIDITLVQRRSVETAGKRTGVETSRARRILAEVVWPVVHEMYGRESWQPFKRLLGNRKGRTEV